MKTAAIIVTQNDDGDFTVLDASGTMHQAFSAQELGDLCCQIVNDPTLPTYKTQIAQVHPVTPDLATKVAQAVLPERFGFVAEPAIGMVKKAAFKFAAWNVGKPVTRIRSTEASRKEGIERALKAKAEKERAIAQAKEQAKILAAQRRKQGPRLPSVRVR